MVGVSVVIPMYNSQVFIEETLQSLLAQTFCDFEAIVIDDCSTDKSVEIVESMSEKFDGRLRLIRQDKNSGGRPGIPRNIGIHSATGKYIFFLDSDDLLAPTALQELYTIAEEINADVLRSEKRYGYRKNVACDKLPISQGFFSVDKITLQSDNIIDRLSKFTSGKFNGHPPWKQFIRRDF